MDATMAGTAEQGTVEQRRSLRRAAYLTIGTGVAHALLFLLAFGLLAGTPGARADDQTLLSFYRSDTSRRLILVGLYIMPFAGIAFLWFSVALRMWIAHSVARENVLLSNIQLVSGILYIALFFGAAAASSTLSASIEWSEAPIDPVVARQFPQFGNTLMLVFAIRMAAMFVFTTSNIGRGAKILPNWFTIGGLVVGLFMLLSATFSPFLVMVFPLWLLTLCVLLYFRARQIPADALVPGHGGTAGQAPQFFGATPGAPPSPPD